MDSSGGHHNEKEVVRLALKQGWQDGEAQTALEEDWQASELGIAKLPLPLPASRLTGAVGLSEKQG